MKVKYVLCFDGQTIESSSEHEIRRIASNTDCYYEIWKHIQPSVKFNQGNQRLSILDIREMTKRFEDGESAKELAKEFKITIGWAQKIIQKERMRKMQSLLKY